MSEAAATTRADAVHGAGVAGRPGVVAGPIPGPGPVTGATGRGRINARGSDAEVREAQVSEARIREARIREAGVRDAGFRGARGVDGIEPS